MAPSAFVFAGEEHFISLSFPDAQLRIWGCAFGRQLPT
jgi:hypothetical protein